MDSGPFRSLRSVRLASGHSRDAPKSLVSAPDAVSVHRLLIDEEPFRPAA